MREQRVRLNLDTRGMKILTALIYALAVSALSAVETTKALYVQFIWGTDQARPAHSREIGPKLSRKLSPVFRWKHYWELDRRKVVVRSQNTTRVDLPRDRKLEIEFVRPEEIEIRLCRRTGLITKTRQVINGKMAILGGEEESKDSFFVVVRQDEPHASE